MASLGLLCFQIFFSGRTCDLKMTPSLQEFRCLGFVPLGARALEECGESGIPMRWGAQRNPGKWLGARAQIIARQPLGDRMEKSKDPASCLQDVHHFPYFPGGDRAQARPHSGPLPPRGCVHGLPQESAHSRTFSWSICCMLSMVLDSSGNVPSCLSGTCDIFFFGGGCISSRNWGTCDSKYL